MPSNLSLPLPGRGATDPANYSAPIHLGAHSPHRARLAERYRFDSSKKVRTVSDSARKTNKNATMTLIEEGTK